MKIYGPYLRADGRKHVILYDSITKKKTTVSYPKYLMEQRLGRKLTEDEEVDHIDEDFTNDDLSNLQVLTKVQHSRKSKQLGFINPNKYAQYICPVCEDTFTRDKRYVRQNQGSQKKAGPFCSRSCAGLYGTQIQAGYKMII